MKRSRNLYLKFIIVTILAGLLSRKLTVLTESWVHLYIGDVLWALMVFFITAFLFSKTRSLLIALLALIFSFSIEFNQLYHAAWIDFIRSNSLGGLILGFGFLWSDLICYAVGITTGLLIDFLYLKKIRLKNQISE